MHNLSIVLRLRPNHKRILFPADARIVHDQTSETYSGTNWLTIWGIPVWKVSRSPNCLIKVSNSLTDLFYRKWLFLVTAGLCLSYTVYLHTTNWLTLFKKIFFWPQGNSVLVSGDCWPFEGEQGRVVIQLDNPVNITHVSLGHISKTKSPTLTINSAPKRFTVYVSNKLIIISLQITFCVPFNITITYIENSTVLISVCLWLLQGMETAYDEETKLGTFLYDEDGDEVQTFKVPVSIIPCYQTHCCTVLYDC